MRSVVFVICLFGAISCTENNSSEKKLDLTVSCKGVPDPGLGVACRELRETNKAFSGKTTVSCSKTFVVNNGYTVSLLEYDSKEVREVRWFLPRVWPNQPPGVVHQASYLCHADMLIATANYRYMVNFGNGEVWSYRDPNISQPIEMLPYKDGILSDSSLLHKGVPAEGMEKSFPRTVRVDENTGEKISVFNWLSHFDIVNLKLVRNYQFDSYCRLKPKYKNAVFYSDGCSNFDRIDLEKDIRYPANNLKIIANWDEGIRDSWELVSSNGKAFRMMFSNSLQYPRETVYEPEKHFPHSTNTLYLLSETTPTKAVVFDKNLDTQYAIEAHGHLYIFTLTSQKVIRLNLDTLEQKIFDFPYTNIAVANYTEEGFVVGIWSEPKDRSKGKVVVTDKKFY